MSDKAEIKKIVIDLGGKDISLTIEQSKKLHEVLHEMFGKKEVTISSYPIYVERSIPYWSQRRFGEILCSSKASEDPYKISYESSDCSMRMSI